MGRKFDDNNCEYLEITEKELAILREIPFTLSVDFTVIPKEFLEADLDEGESFFFRFCD